MFCNTYQESPEKCISTVIESSRVQNQGGPTSPSIYILSSYISLITSSFASKLSPRDIKWQEDRSRHKAQKEYLTARSKHGGRFYYGEGGGIASVYAVALSSESTSR